MVFAAFVLANVLYGIGPPSKPAPKPSGPQFTNGVAVRAALQTRALGVDPDGNERWLLRIAFTNARGAQTFMRYGGDVDFIADRGGVQWQPRLRYRAFSAIAETNAPGLIHIVARVNAPIGFPEMHASIDVPSAAAIAGGALGSHLVQLGWFPRSANGEVAIARADGASRARFTVPAPSSTFFDASVRPGATYTYRITLPDGFSKSLRLHVPRVRPATLDVARGKGMWLFFSCNPADANFIGKWNVGRMLHTASRAGIHSIAVRVSYGAYWEIESTARPYVDALLDGAAKLKIPVLAWTVPREASYDDLVQNLKALQYRTRAGNHFTGLSLDLETGPDFMGDGPIAFGALVRAIYTLRRAFGPAYPLVATIIDPATVNWAPTDYPYAGIARYASVLQPMTYWRTWSRGITTPQKTAAIVCKSIRTVRVYAHTNVPINVGGQTTDLSPEGPTPPAEIRASLAASKRCGAIGETFFDWKGTSAAQWRAIGSIPWR